MSRVDPTYYYTISPAIITGPISPILSLILETRQPVMLPSQGPPGSNPDQVWYFVPVPGPHPLYMIHNRELGRNMALTIDPGSRFVGIEEKDDQKDQQKWEVVMVEGDGGSPVYRMTNMAAGPSVSLEIGNEEKLVLGREGGEPFLWGLRRVGEVE